MVIGDRPLVEYLPLMRESKSDGEASGIGVNMLSQYEFNAVEKIGLLKMDFLGLINLSMIENTVAFVKQTHGIDVDIEHIPLDDKPTFDLFSSGEMTGVFQMESPAACGATSSSSSQRPSSISPPWWRSTVPGR